MPFTATPPELQIVGALFEAGDPTRTGIITADNAVSLLSTAHLPADVLGQIWAIADSDNNGFLTRKSASVVVRLIGWAQKGEPVSEDLLNRVGPLPTIEGLKLGKTTSPKPASPVPTASSSVPPLKAADRNKFVGLFNSCGPANGILSGDKAQAVFLRSNLPNEKLGAIWNLADTQGRGALDLPDFIIGMYFIQLAMSQPWLTIPDVLPPGLYDQAAGHVTSHATGSSISAPGPGSLASPGLGNSVRGIHNAPTGVIRPQGTGTASVARSGTLSNQVTGSVARLSMAPSALSNFTTPTSSAFSPAATGLPWDITPQEKATADQFYATLDTQGRGYIEGDEAVPFMKKSNLPEADLAQIWDLADMHNDGRLTSEGFAIALHLINGKISGKEIPKTLPQSLIPPAMRKDVSARSQVQNDMWLLGETPPATANNPQPPFGPQTTGGGYGFQSPERPVVQARMPPARSAFEKDLLGDDDSPEATPVTQTADHSIEIANVQNQLTSTNRSLSSTKAEREQVSSNVESSAFTLAQLETQLAAAKAAYDTETRLLGDLRERFGTQNASIQAARQQLITAESDLSALRQEKNEIGGQLLRDKDEVRELQRRIKQTADETEVVKKDIEKAKKDAKHQKGLLAIGKKQLTTAEAGRDKAVKELEVAQKELEVATVEVEESQRAEREAIAAASPISSPPLASPEEKAAVPLTFAAAFMGEEMASPTPKSTRSNNPFDKIKSTSTGGSGSGSNYLPFASPAAIEGMPQQQAEDPFGFNSVFAGQSVQTPPPVASQIPSPKRKATDISTPPRSISPVPRAGSPLARVASLTRTQTPPVRTASPASSVPRTMSPAMSVPRTTSPAPAPVVAAAPAAVAAVPGPSAFEDIKERKESTDLDASRFPPLEDDGAEPDLPPLKEIHEVESSEEDSDSEDYADAKAHISPVAPKFTAGQAADSTTPRPTSPPVTVLSNSTASAFDDAFGTGNTGSVIDAPSSVGHASVQRSAAGSPTPSGTVGGGSVNDHTTTPFDIPAAPAQQRAMSSFETIMDKPKPVTTTVSDFDEAFGLGHKAEGTAGTANTAPTTGSAFSFDDTFGETFDFGGATTMPGALPASPAPHVDAFTAIGSAMTGLPAATPAPSAFDDAFGLGTPAATQAPPKVTPGVSFDDAFNLPKTNEPVKTASPNLASPAGFTNLDSPHAASPNPISPPRPSGPASPVPSYGLASGSVASPRAAEESPKSSLRLGKPRKDSVNRESVYSPPGGMPPESPIADGASATSSAPATKHKFHFPGFGRSKTVKDKKKGDKEEKKITPPAVPTTPRPSIPSNSVSASVYNATRATAPGEDVEGVRSITAMGFSREQAVEALEKHGYNMNLALNDLLENSAPQ